ncbi:hypothetical protein [Azotosporobacter soli]|uniref:hypothetical protein n=1 Tax=Azotosporobacter soli TaxID=3055040 RepID=UPI0031FE5350
MVQRYVFSSGQETITDFLTAEGIVCITPWADQFFSFLSRACSYEEEGRRIKPRIVLSRNLIKSRIVERISNAYIVPIKKVRVGELHFEKNLKSLIPFCRSGWHVYIDVEGESVGYGIFRFFSGPMGDCVTDSLFRSEDAAQEDVAAVCIEVLSDFELKFKGFKREMIIDFRLCGSENSRMEDVIGAAVEDIVSGIKDLRDKEILCRVFDKIFKLSVAQVHGTLCAVVKADTQMPLTILEDGIWLPEPIDISTIALALLKDITDIYMDEKFYGLIDVVLEMFNMDGITVMDTKGRLLAYNAFVEAQATAKRVSGGARKRAMMALLESGVPELVGAYFQSQDGQVIYKGVKRDA